MELTDKYRNWIKKTKNMSTLCGTAKMFLKAGKQQRIKHEDPENKNKIFCCFQEKNAAKKKRQQCF